MVSFNESADWPGAFSGIYEYFSNIFFAQLHLQTVSVLQATVIHLNLNLSSNGSKKIHENE